MKARLNIDNQKFGRLLVLRSFVLNKKTHCECECECGNTTTVRASSLVSGNTKSCGCLHATHYNVKKRVRTEPHWNLKHGRINTKEYRSWSAIKKRCLNKNDEHYGCYGGRGIKVCSEWMHSFEQFYKDMGDAPSAGHTIDRIDYNGDYCKENCRWATSKEQQNNRRNNIHIVIDGKSYTVQDIADIVGCSKSTIHSRIYDDNFKNRLLEPLHNNGRRKREHRSEEL